MKAFVTVSLASVVALAAACSSAPTTRAPSSEYWQATTTGANQFPGDNLACSARAARLGNVSSPAPENRLDRPMQKWPNASAQEIYQACMGERGWRPAG